MRDELRAAAQPLLDKLKDHPFFVGLRDGSLAGGALLHFARQDADFLLPGYGRALARTAAQAHDHAHAMVFAKMAVGTLEARQAMAMGYDIMADQLGDGHDDSWRAVPANPVTHAYTTFLASASASSLAEAVGALLPCSWFYIQIADDLRDRHDPGARYAEWVKALHPGDDFREVLDELLTVVDEVGERCSADDRARLAANFVTAARYEWSFIDAALVQLDWPV
ncbi:TenA family protein [Streptomyces sp. NPDC059063]|uniref:TenA family protein n=1 Tax=unclassified Streptomyces TaxID=2593676 RepID=UPI0036BC46A4